MITLFTKELIKTIRDYRNRAAMAGLNSLCISIEIEGRIDGDFKITYTCRERYGESVSGNTLEDVFKEMLRRKGWVETHQALCLSNVEGGDISGDFVKDKQ